MKPAWLRAAEFAGLAPDQAQIELIERYGDWLSTEARGSGGIGPSEVDRIERRHLGDSLLFATHIPTRPAEVWDLGSGVGLPGIPLAICLPDTHFVLIDRSGRRVDLIRRALRILWLENCEVVRAGIGDMEGSPDVIVSRATLPPGELLVEADRLLGPGGVAIAGGSWRQPPEHSGWTAIEIPSFVLDQTVWLLIMRPE